LCGPLAAAAVLLGAGTAPAQEPGALTVPVLPDKVGPGVRAEPVQLYTHSFALVIGIDAYQHRGWPRLSNAVRDAEEVAAALARQGFTVTLRKDVTSAELEATLKDFFIRVGAETEARLLMWFAGHGETINGEGYLVPADAPASSAGAAFRLKALSLRRFGEYMHEAQSKHVLAVFDSCFAGTVFGKVRARPSTSIRRDTMLPVRQMISSGGAGEKVSDDGTFRRLFIAALEGEEPAADGNGDGFLTASELGIFLADKVTNQMVNKARKPLQTPRWGKLQAFGDDRGDFVFRVGGVAKVAAKRLPEEKTVPAAAGPPSEAAEAYGVAKQVDTIAAWEAFIRRYGDTFYGDLAKARLEELKQAVAARQAAETKKQADEAARAKAEAERVARLEAEKAAQARERERIALEQKQREEERRKARHDPALSVEPGSGKSFRDCPDVCPEMVVVPKGSFTMGSPPAEKGASDEGPQHEVRIARPFAVGKYEVTRGEFAAFISESVRVAGDRCYTDEGGRFEERSGRSFRNPGFVQDDRHPAVCVSFEDATAFAAWLTWKTGKAYRLLSEAEWEYAARAGTATRYHFGQNERDLCTYGNVGDLTAKKKFKHWETIANCRDGHVYTAPAGAFRPNAFGLHDMHGNVWEWVQDCGNGSYNGALSDGSAWTTGDCSRRVLRGGSWGDFPWHLRSAVRSRPPPDLRNYNVGFRVGRTL
jgi:formylglycine-generating enzyme required for sulfatase activity